MANIKITELNAAGSLAATDVVPVVDVSADETKKITTTNLFRTLPDGTAAAPALAFSSDQANGVYLAGTDTVGISTGGTQRVTVDGSGNVTISGDLQVNGATTTVQSTTVTIDDKNIELGSVASPSNTTADGGGITLKGATDKTIKWINSTGFWTFNTGVEIDGNLQMDDGKRIRLGTGQDLQIYHDGSNSYIDDAGTGGLEIRGNQIKLAKYTGETLATFIADSEVQLRYDNAIKFKTKSDGIDVTGEVQCDYLDVDGGVDIDGGQVFYDATNNVLKFADNAQLRFGASNDFRFYHNGTNNQVDNYTGTLFINQYVDDADIILRSDNGSGGITNYIQCDGSSGATKLFHYGSEKLQTKSDGILVQGEVQSDSLDVNGAADISGDLGVGDPSPDARCVIYRATQFSGNTVFAVKSDAGSTKSTKFMVDGDGKVGIGTTSANYLLTALAGSGSQNIFQAGQTGVSNGYTISSNGSALTHQWHSGSGEAARINNSGRLLVGTTTTSVHGDRLIEIGSTSRSATYQAITTSTSGTGGIVFADTTTNDNGGYRGIIQYAHSSDSLQFSTAATERVRIASGGDVILKSGNLTWDTATTPMIVASAGSSVLRFGTAGSERLRIDSSGRLMLGTTTEGSAEADTFTIAESGSAGMTIRSGTAARGSIFFSDGTSGAAEYDGQIQYDQSARWMRFATAQTERLRISSAGDILAKTIDARIGSDVGAVEYGTSTANSVRFYSNNAERFRIDPSGRFMLGTTTEGYPDADNFTLADSGHCGITIRSGATSAGAIYFSDGTSGNAEYRGYFLYDHDGDHLRFGTAAAERLRILSTGAWSIEGANNYGTSGQVLTSNGNDAPTWQDAGAASVGGANAISMNDNVKINFGGGNDLQIYHSGSHSYIKDAGQGNLYIASNRIEFRNAADNESLANFIQDGAIELYYDNSKKFETKSDGVSVFGQVSCNDLNVAGELNMMGSSDGAKYLDVRLGSNTFNIRGTSGGDTGHETLAQFTRNGPVKLYYDNVQKLQTKTDGVDITGELQCDSLDCDGGADFTGDALFRGGANAVLIKANSDIRFENGNWTGNSTSPKIQGHGNALYIAGGNNGIIFRENGTDRCQIDASGHLKPSQNNTYDLGTSSLRWRNIYTNDLNLSNEGSSNDVDGTWGNYTIQEGEDDLFLINRRNGKKYKFNLTEVS